MPATAGVRRGLDDRGAHQGPGVVGGHDSTQTVEAARESWTTGAGTGWPAQCCPPSVVASSRPFPIAIHTRWVDAATTCMGWSGATDPGTAVPTTRQWLPPSSLTAIRTVPWPSGGGAHARLGEVSATPAWGETKCTAVRHAGATVVALAGDALAGASVDVPPGREVEVEVECVQPVASAAVTARAATAGPYPCRRLP